MWRRTSSKLLTFRSVPRPNRIVTSPSLTLRSSTTIITRHFSGGDVTKKVEDVMPITTGHEHEELEAELHGWDILDINFPEGPFGTKGLCVLLIALSIIVRSDYQVELLPFLIIVSMPIKISHAQEDDPNFINKLYNLHF